MPRLFPILLLLFALLTVIKPEGTIAEPTVTATSDEYSTLNQEPEPTVPTNLPVKQPPTLRPSQGGVIIVKPKKNLTAAEQAIINGSSKPPPKIGITNPPKVTTPAAVVSTTNSKAVNTPTNGSVNIKLPTENTTEPKPVRDGKRADLASCFNKNENIICFVGEKCRYGPILLENSEERHEEIVGLSQKSLMNMTSARKEVIAKCNVGAIFTMIEEGLYKYEYHTTSNNTDLRIVFHNYEIFYEEENAEMDCEPTCEINTNDDSSDTFSDTPYLTGEISIPWDGNSPSPQRNGKRPKPSKAERKEKDVYEKETEEKSKLGIYLAIGAASLVVLIVIAVVVVIMIQRYNTAKANKLRAEIEVEVKAKVAEQMALSRSKSVDRTRSKEQSPLLQSTQSTATASTSVSAVGLEPFSDPFSGSE